MLIFNKYYPYPVAGLIKKSALIFYKQITWKFVVNLQCIFSAESRETISKVLFHAKRAKTYTKIAKIKVLITSSLRFLRPSDDGCSLCEKRILAF